MSGSQKWECFPLKVSTGLTTPPPHPAKCTRTGAPPAQALGTGSFLSKGRTGSRATGFCFSLGLASGAPRPPQETPSCLCLWVHGRSFFPPDRLGHCVYEAGCKSFRASRPGPCRAEACHRFHAPHVPCPSGHAAVLSPWASARA